MESEVEMEHILYFKDLCLTQEKFYNALREKGRGGVWISLMRQGKEKCGHASVS